MTEQRMNQKEFLKNFIIDFALAICLFVIIVWEQAMKQLFMYLLALSLALLGTGAKWLTSSNIENLKEEDKQFVYSRRKIFNRTAFIALSFSAAGFFISFIDEEPRLNYVAIIAAFFISVSALLLGILFIKIQKK